MQPFFFFRAGYHRAITKKKNRLKIEAMKSNKQKKLNQDYANFLVEYETAKTQGIALGTFLEWLHKNDPEGIKIDDSRKR